MGLCQAQAAEPRGLTVVGWSVALRLFGEGAVALRLAQRVAAREEKLAQPGACEGGLAVRRVPRGRTGLP